VERVPDKPVDESLQALRRNALARFAETFASAARLSTCPVDNPGDKSVGCRRIASGGAGAARFDQTLVTRADVARTSRDCTKQKIFDALIHSRCGQTSGEACG
jgi:hypothetical protein